MPVSLLNRMKSNILGMESNMEHLLDKVSIFIKFFNSFSVIFSPINDLHCFPPMQIMSVQSRSDSVNTCLSENREHIEKLNRTCNLLRKIQV